MYITKDLTASLKKPITPSSDVVVAILSNDAAISSALREHVSRSGWRLERHSSAATFFGSAQAGFIGCIVVDANLADLSVSELTHLICSHAIHCPIVVLTSTPNATSTVTTSKFRVTFVPKPSDLRFLAHEIDAAIRAVNDASRLEAHFLSLTPRERQVMKFVAEGLLNKQVAFKLNISEITVKAHRGQVMKKMNARTLPDLVNMAARLGSASGSNPNYSAVM